MGRDQAYLFTVDASKYRILYTGSAEVGFPFLLCLFQFRNFVFVRYRSCKAKACYQFFFQYFSCSSEYMCDYPGLLHDVQKRVLAPANDRANHVTLPCGLTRVIYCLCSSSWLSPLFWGGLFAYVYHTPFPARVGESYRSVGTVCLDPLLLLPLYPPPPRPGEMLDPLPLSGWGVRLWASLCVTPPRGGG